MGRAGGQGARLREGSPWAIGWPSMLIVGGSLALGMLWPGLWRMRPAREARLTEGPRLFYGGEITEAESLEVEPLLFVRRHDAGEGWKDHGPVLPYAAADGLPPLLLQERRDLEIAGLPAGGHDADVPLVSPLRRGFVPMWARARTFENRGGGERRLVVSLSPALVQRGFRLPESGGPPLPGGAWEATLRVRLDAAGRPGDVVIQQGPESDVLRQWLTRQVEEGSAAAAAEATDGQVIMAYGLP